jgi:hypothetical protein
MPAKEDMDSIFESTGAKGKKAAKKPAKKKSPAKKPAKKAAPKKTAVKKAPAKAASDAKQAPAAKVDTADALNIDRFSALSTVLHNHEAEALYRKGKEDRVLVLSCGLLAALVLGIMIVLATDVTSGWFGRLILKLFFAGGAALVGLAGSSILELNRKRLQDVLAMIVKIHESFGLFSEGTYPTGNGAYFPNTYKFIGSINDDETNYAQLMIKIASAGAVIAILLLG